ncbi:MAG: Nif3-like dinuclear metal center hexameric protein [Salinispira sp.]
MNIQDVDGWFQNLLSIPEFTKIDSSANGIQVGHNISAIKKIAFAVDACRETFMRSEDADVLVVHHGLFWGREQCLRGYHYERIRFLMEHGIALYAIHLPLDAHNTVGNNYGMAHFLGMEDLSPFGFFKGTAIGVSGMLPEKRELSDIQRTLFGSTVLGTLPFGTDTIGSAAIVSGGGTFAVDEAIEKGIDLFITGDASHNIYHRCLEARINVIFAGHYASEIWGVKLLMEHFLQGPGAECGIGAEFIDLPTGL